MREITNTIRTAYPDATSLLPWALPGARSKPPRSAFGFSSTVNAAPTDVGAEATADTAADAIADIPADAIADTAAACIAELHHSEDAGDEAFRFLLPRNVLIAVSFGKVSIQHRPIKECEETEDEGHHQKRIGTGCYAGHAGDPYDISGIVDMSCQTEAAFCV